MDAMSFAVDFQHDRSVLHFLEVRRILEPAAMALAAATMSDDDIAGLGELLDELPPEPGVEESVDNDLEFHRRIAVVPETPSSPRSSTASPAVPSAPGSGGESLRRRRYAGPSTSIVRSSRPWPAVARRSRTPPRWCTSPASSNGCATPSAAVRTTPPVSATRGGYRWRPVSAGRSAPRRARRPGSRGGRHRIPPAVACAATPVPSGNAADSTSTASARHGRSTEARASTAPYRNPPPWVQRVHGSSAGPATAASTGAARVYRGRVDRHPRGHPLQAAALHRRDPAGRVRADVEQEVPAARDDVHQLLDRSRRRRDSAVRPPAGCTRTSSRCPGSSPTSPGPASPGPAGTRWCGSPNGSGPTDR